MKIADMHYDFKRKLNKLDSQEYRNLKIPEIDWILNEALQLFALLIAVPRLRNHLGFETFQRTIDDIYPLVVDDHYCTVASQGTGYTIYSLPTDYLAYQSVNAIAYIDQDQLKTCGGRKMDVTVIKHNNRSENRSFYNSSFQWGQLNVRFLNTGIKAYHADFLISTFRLDYIKRHVYIHNAKDFLAGGYTLPGGTVLTGSVDCELPEHTHTEIVDIAVLLAAGELELPTAYQLKQNKLNLKQLN
jgi:hypothetical protein